MKILCLCVIGVAVTASTFATDIMSADEVAQMLAARRGDNLWRLVQLRISKASKTERDLLLGQLVWLGGPVLERTNPIKIDAGGNLQCRVHLLESHIASLAGMTEPTLIAYIEGSIRRIDPKTRTVEIDATDARFRPPKRAPKPQQ